MDLKIESYEKDMERRNLSPHTIKHTIRRLKRFAIHLGIELERITLEDIDHYIDYLKEQGLCQNSIQTQLINFKGFFRWANERGYTKIESRFIKVGKRKRSFQMQPLSREEIEMLYNAVPHVYKTKMSIVRNRAIVRFLYSTGCRIFEVVKLNREDIDLEKCQVIVEGKGDRRRVVFLDQQTIALLNEYFSLRTDHLKPLFISHGVMSSQRGDKHENARISYKAYQEILRELAKKAGIEKPVSPHKIRHTYATQLMKNGAPIRAIQELLGHSSLETTQMYLHTTSDWMRSVFDEYHR